MWYLTDTRTNLSEQDEDLTNLILGTLEDSDIKEYIKKEFEPRRVFIPYIGEIPLGEVAIAVAIDKCLYSDLAYNIAADIASDIAYQMKEFGPAETKTVYFSHYLITSDTE